MKKYLFFAATALALASCSSDDYLGGNPGNENGANNAINFSSNAGTVTRAANPMRHEQSADALNKNFVIVGFKGSEKNVANHTTYAFDHYNVNYVANSAGSTVSNTADWEYVGQGMNVKGTNPAASLAQEGAKEQTIKYWDNSCGSYDFIAFSMGKGYGDADPKEYAVPTAVDKDNLGTKAYTLTGDVNTLGECYISDMKTVEKADYSTTAVQLQFRHATSKVRMALFETVPGYVVNEVQFYNNAGEESTTAGLTGSFNTKATLNVYFPTTGLENKVKKPEDYNVAHVDVTNVTQNQDLTFNTVNYANEKENQIEAGTTYLGQSRSKASYCGGTTDAEQYIPVLPAENNGENISLKVDYTLTSTDGTNEVIHVKGATATIPEKYAKWKPGYAYTYIFKISQDTNGTTGGPGDKPGLTAISFDAVVLEDQTNGNQETITTVANPSITTYGFKGGKVTTDGDEYVAGTDIYATVFVPAVGAGQDGKGAEPAKTVAPQKLYTVKIEDGAAQKITESSVANALVKGVNDASANTWTVTDAKGKKLVVTETEGANTVATVPAEDGHNLEVNALKWTGTANTIYAVEYEYTDNGTTKKSYKIVNVK